MSTSIEPGKTTTKHFDVEGLALQVSTVHVGDLQLATLGRLDVLGDIHNFVIVEIQTGYRVVGLGLQRFLFDAESTTSSVEFNHAKTLGVGDVVAKHCCTSLLLSRRAQVVREVLTVEDVVA